MNLVLTGFMGTGKTAVGRRLAETLRAAFIDVDEIIEKKAGKSVAAIFASMGEPVFRRLESDAVAEVSALDRTVIATGGGVLLNPAHRVQLERNGLLVCLTAKAETLLERLKNDVRRPLLAGESLPERMERLLKERESIYAACPIQVATDGKTIAEVAEAVLSHVKDRWTA